MSQLHVYICLVEVHAALPQHCVSELLLYTMLPHALTNAGYAIISCMHMRLAFAGPS